MRISLAKSKAAMARQNSTRTSSSGNRTPVSRVTGGDTHHYTNEEQSSAVDVNVNPEGRNCLRENGGNPEVIREPSALPSLSGHGGRPYRSFRTYLRPATSCVCLALSLNTRFTVSPASQSAFAGYS